MTSLTRFQSNEESVCEFTADGQIRSRGPGDAYVISFYDNGIFSTQVLYPVSDLVAEAYPDVAEGTALDRRVLARLRKLGIVPSPVCGDEQFLRRVSLDLTCTLPTPEEIRQFAADPSPNKRLAKVDELLERPAYVTWWTTRLCDLTGSNAGGEAPDDATNIHPDDIAATLYHAVGLDPRAEYHSPTGRPVMLAPQGRVLPV